MFSMAIADTQLFHFSTCKATKVCVKTTFKNDGFT